jgi:hypothetical protein
LIQTQRDLIDAQSRLVAAERTAAQAEIDAARTRTLLMAVALAQVADREGAATRVPGRPDPTDGVRTAPEERAASGGTDLSVEQEKPSASSASSEQLLGLQADSASHEAAMAGLIGEIRRLDSDGSRMRGVVDSAGLHVLDPVHTGRYRWSQLTKIEKSSLGGIVLNRLQREFGFNDGRSLDLEIAGHEVDLKFTLGSNWTVPAEAVGALCLLLHADDSKGVWSMGLIRAEPGVLSGGANRDGKRTLSAEGLAAVRWIHRNLPLPAHALKQLPQEVVNRIFAKQWGQSRTEELFRSAGLTPITRADLDAVAMQQDSTKRVRTIRQEMASHGILVLSGSLSSDVYRAQALGLPIPAKDAWLSVRLVPAPEQRDGAPVIMLGGDAWCVAQPGDPEAPLPPGSLARAG